LIAAMHLLFQTVEPAAVEGAGVTAAMKFSVRFTGSTVATILTGGNIAQDQMPLLTSSV
jgi:threonine dehydratase